MKILLRTNKHESWATVESAAYVGETELQRLLFETPALITLDEIQPGSPPLYAAVREFPLQIGSVDLLAFNAEGEIAIIECKLAENPEIKRKVIGQVLEYGANLWQMSYEELDQKVKSRSGCELAELMKGAFSTSEDEEIFRENVEAALKSGKFILMIVVDEINEELGRIVNYLNVCGSPAFAFAALEMRRFSKGEVDMLVPHVLGAPQVSITPQNGARKKWDESSFTNTVQETQSTKVAKVIEDLYNWSKKNASKVVFGTGSVTGSFTFHYADKNGVYGSVFSIFTNGSICINFVYLEKIFTKETIESFREQLVGILTYEKSKNINQSYFTIGIENAFEKNGSLDQFKQIVLELRHMFIAE